MLYVRPAGGSTKRLAIEILNLYSESYTPGATGGAITGATAGIFKLIYA